MYTYNQINFSDRLEDYVSSWKTEHLIFSYKIRCSWSEGSFLLTLIQEQTEVSLSLIIQKAFRSIRITSLNLKENCNFEDYCSTLYDAGLIEVIIQTLKVTCYLAENLNVDEIFFLLPREEAEHLQEFYALFDDISTPSTREGKRTLLKLIITPLHYENFIEHIQSIRIELCQKLWLKQRTDTILQNYLQKGILQSIPYKALDNKAGKLALNNIVPFPLSRARA